MRRHAILTLLLLCTALAGCLAPSGARPTDPADASLGAVTLLSGRLGQATLHPNRCEAGDRAFFLGGDFVDDRSGLVVRLAFDPLEGAAVRVFAREGGPEKSIAFRRADCRVLSATLEPTHWKINDVSDYHLALKFECARGADAAAGEVVAAHCH